MIPRTKTRPNTIASVVKIGMRDSQRDLKSLSWVFEVVMSLMARAHCSHCTCRSHWRELERRGTPLKCTLPFRYRSGMVERRISTPSARCVVVNVSTRPRHVTSRRRWSAKTAETTIATSARSLWYAPHSIVAADPAVVAKSHPIPLPATARHVVSTIAAQKSVCWNSRESIIDTTFPRMPGGPLVTTASKKNAPSSTELRRRCMRRISLFFTPPDDGLRSNPSGLWSLPPLALDPVRPGSPPPGSAE
mmetsp:Transcript_4284/g.9377  ORF Transcript_4284/g.9377 Transcript_4284/m.9377 type:complete len:248 (+) Transcript_4284:1912-2655(+)